jgi:hypothetical protein
MFLNHEGYFPPSINQERFLVGEDLRRNRGKGPYPFHVIEGLSITGLLNRERIERSVDLTIARHAGLQAAFISAPKSQQESEAPFTLRKSETNQPVGQYRQFVQHNVRLPVEWIDLSLLDGHTRSETLSETIKERALCPFEVSQAPLARATVFQLDTHHYLLFIVFHHLITDMTSQRVLRAEIRRCYESLANERQPELPDVYNHYPGFAAWQQRAAFSADSIAYWQDKLVMATEGEVSFRDFPFAQSRVAGGPPVPAYESVVLNGAMSGKLRAAARKAHVTLSVLFTAGLAVVLHRWTGRQVLSMWSNFANRVDPWTEGMVGWLVNSHLIPFNLSGSPTVQATLQSVRETMLGAAMNQSVPREVALRGLGRASSGSDLRVMFDFVTEERCEAIEPGVSFRRLPVRYLRQFRPPMGLEVLAIDEGASIRLMAGYFLDRLPTFAVRQLLNGIGRAAVFLCEAGRDARISAFPLVG